MSITPEAIAVVFAEEFRAEQSGQITAVGVWPPMLTVDEFPWSEAVAPMILWRDMVDEIDLTLEIRGRSGAQFAAAKFKTGVDGGASEVLSYLPLPARRISLSAPDVIEVVITINGGEEQVIGRMIVQAGEEVAQQLL